MEAFEPSISASKKEREWIIESLTPFYTNGWIVDCHARVKAGKEATVYICEAHPETGMDYLAAKIYRPRDNRAMRNYSAYQEGRFHLGVQGGVIKDSRALRAIEGKSRFGQQLITSSWLAYEFGTLQRLHGVGVAVPEPLEMIDSTILMEFIGHEGLPAPALSDVQVAPGSAKLLLDSLLEDIREMLACDLVHGDLSPHNILYLNEEYTIIDVPQAVNPNQNPNAFDFLVRDIRNVAHYFRPYGLEVDAVELAVQWYQEYRLEV